jgi:hypothetical protein
MDESNGIEELKIAAEQLHDCAESMRADRYKPVVIPPIAIDDTGWNFKTFGVYIAQRFSDLSLQLQQRFEAQQSGLGTAMIAAEKAVNAALIAAEKAVDKAEQAQALRNQAQNEFRQSLSDLSGLMWTTKEGTAALEALRREVDIRIKQIEINMNGINAMAANLQGKITMIGIVWGIIVVVASVAIKFL